MTSIMQLIITLSAVAIAACAIIFTVLTWREHHNADLVKFGVGVLRVDPEKEKQIGAAREWALNLIDANAGGVKFSPETRAQLLEKPLSYNNYAGDYYSYIEPVKPAPHHSSPEPPK
jgi:hypothetical protein